MKQQWFCESCLEDGSVSITLNADIWSVVNKIEDHHRKKSPSCPIGVCGLRVRNREVMSLAEWRKMRAALRNERTRTREEQHDGL